MWSSGSSTAGDGSMLDVRRVEIVQDDWRMTADIRAAVGQRHGADRTVRIRQEHAPRRHRRLRRAGARPHPLGGPRPGAAGAGRAAGDAALPGAQSLRPPDRRPERRPRRASRPAPRPQQLGARRGGAGGGRPRRHGCAASGEALRRPAPAGRAGARAPARPAAAAARRALRRPRPGDARRDARPRRPHPPEQDATLVLVTHRPRTPAASPAQVVLVDGHRAYPPVATEAIFANPPPELRAYLG